MDIRCGIGIALSCESLIAVFDWSGPPIRLGPVPGEPGFFHDRLWRLSIFHYLGDHRIALRALECASVVVGFIEGLYARQPHPRATLGAGGGLDLLGL